MDVSSSNPEASAWQPAGRPARIVICAMLFVLLLAPAEAGSWRDKVDAGVLAKDGTGQVEFMVYLSQQADLREAPRSTSREAKAAWVIDRLQRTATRTQEPLIALLELARAEYRSYWIANVIWVRGETSLVERIATRPEVQRVEANTNARLERPRAQREANTDWAKTAQAVEWNVSKIRADEVWAMGYTGDGVVIGGQDTGYDWEHPALKRQYRGWDGSQADHAYNWHDSIHTGGGSCGVDSPEPCDDSSHGTHTMGTMVGDDGGSNLTGVSPGSRWIGCRNMDQGDGTPATYTECFQWFVAPTDANGQNPDPAKAPLVINNSWACPDFEGCALDTLRSVVENTRAAGIVVVTSAGNSGSSCETVIHSPAIYEAAFSIGATNDVDLIAGFSSRGPVAVDGSDRMKPEVSAPGVSVRSSVPGRSYAVFSGTSMAGPHVAGVVALLLDARPDLAGQVDTIEFIIRRSAVPLTSNETCGGVEGTTIPNNTYGHGRVDAMETIFGDADADSSSNLADCLPADASVWSGPGPSGRLTLDGGDPVGFSWAEPAIPGASTVSYQLVRSADAADFSQATCIAPDGVRHASDGSNPAELFFYLVQTENPCGVTVGVDSAGNPRTLPSCR
jgi:serine protease AprX